MNDGSSGESNHISCSSTMDALSEEDSSHGSNTNYVDNGVVLSTFETRNQGDEEERGDLHQKNNSSTDAGKRELWLLSSDFQNNELDEEDGDASLGYYSSAGSTSLASNSRGATSTQETSSWNHYHNELGARAVRRARQIFLTLLFLAAIVLSSVVYWTTKMEDTQDFNSQFENYGWEVIESSNENVLKVFQDLETLSVTITGFIKEQRSNGYPAGFVKIPDTEYHLANVMKNSDAFLLGYNPHVKKEDYYLWNKFSAENQDWIFEANDAVKAQKNVAAAKNETDGDTTTPDNDSLSSNENTTLIFPYVFGVEYYDENGDKIDISDDVATCANKKKEADASLSKVAESIKGFNVVPLDPTDYKKDAYVPFWQYTPAPEPSQSGAGLINYNLAGDPIFAQILDIISKTRKTTFFDICGGSQGLDPSIWPEDGVYSMIVTPVFDNHGENSIIVGSINTIVTWRVFFEDILVKGSLPVHVVMKNKCGKQFTYRVDGHDASFLGHDVDIHNPKYDEMHLSSPFADFAYSEEYLAADGKGESCTYSINVYPTIEFENFFTTQDPVVFSLTVLSVFVCTTLAFFVFDWLVQRRQKSLASTAAKQNALVSSLFPRSIQKKLLAETEEMAAMERKQNLIGKIGLRNYLNDKTASASDKNSSSEKGVSGATLACSKTKPIADLFPETTVMFADIAGFTAWSSTREPTQVFTLLESIYREFDLIAERRRVFKVETIGDCYVAVCGLPDPRSTHAVIMARFAKDCMKMMHQSTDKLERELGPDTAELGLRIGLHSGPVVAGVLRGDKSRFQLFGDTVNTASRMESTSKTNKIQISQETANCLIKTGERYRGWFTEREDKVEAKGKGELKTFWLHLGEQKSSSLRKKSRAKRGNSDADDSTETSFLDDSVHRCERQNSRVAKWTVEILSNLLKEIIDFRNDHNIKLDPISHMEALEAEQNDKRGNPLDEVKEIICLPEYRARVSLAMPTAKRGTTFSAMTAVVAGRKNKDVGSLNDDVMRELLDFVNQIMSLYNNKNPFHNFSHASHVTMSVIKLLSRIVAPDIDEFCDKSLHDHTYGITSDPLTRFAVVFSALIHDLDHPGVPNGQLIREEDPMAAAYKNRSVAEQNSVDIAWDLLMEPAYTNLRRVIYVNEDEFKRFRQLVVNTVMATDIMDKDLKDLRNKRWDAAFHHQSSASKISMTGSVTSTTSMSESSSIFRRHYHHHSNKNLDGKNNEDSSPLDSRMDVNRKATIVIEHLIQASDVAHTMQHWHVYRKWNQRFFMETYQAYLDGRVEGKGGDGKATAAGRTPAKDPSETWYEGEIGFFDFYIIPLAKKLKECGVFGVASDEYLNYAIQNRQEWEKRGRDVVKEMMQSIRAKEENNYDDKDKDSTTVSNSSDSSNSYGDEESCRSNN